MKTNGNDILASRSELKKMPYDVPDGYFETFKAEMSHITTAGQRPGIWKGRMTYMAVAASLALLLSLGTMLMRHNSSDETMSPEEYILFSDNLISTEIYQDPSEYQIAEAADLLEEEIIEYLIYTDVSLETIELLK